MLSYGHGTSPITMDMGCFKIQYRNALGGNRLGIFKTGTAEEARIEFNEIPRRVG